jgi:hypothetical protein
MTGPITSIAKIAMDVAAHGEVEVYVRLLVDEPVHTGLRLVCHNDSDVPMAVDIDMTVRPDPDE